MKKVIITTLEELSKARTVGAKDIKKRKSKGTSESESLARAKEISKYSTWESFHESQKGKTYKDFIGRTTTIGDAEHDKRNSRYLWESAKKWIDAGGRPK